VFTLGSDPVREGFVNSLNRPGGNVTGITFFSAMLSSKSLGLLYEVVPNAAVIALMVNPNNPESARVPSDALEAARSLGWQLVALSAGTASEIDGAFDSLRQRGAGALLVVGNPFFTARRKQIVERAARDGIPTMYVNREFVMDGGLMSYGNDVVDVYRRAGVYVGRILNGASPADLPIDQATKFEFLINLKTAKALGAKVSDNLLTLADEVIE
jgi:ABC-type uncharacterized transport system substrate-binding protein